MSSITKRRGRAAGAILLALLVALSAFAPATTAIPKAPDEIAIEQTASEATVEPGGTVDIETTVNASELNAPALAVTLPDGWEIQSQSADGPATYKPSTAEWIWLSGGEYDVTYTVAVPADADDGEYTVGAEASAIDPATDEFVEDSTETTITVATDDEPENQSPTADAGDDQTVDAGDSVTLDASGSDDPDGDDLSYEWTQTGGPDVSLDDASSATPTFTAPDVDADETLTFEVEVSDGEDSDTDEVSVTVENADEADPPDDEPPAEEADVTVEQTASSDTVAPGETVTFDVTIDATGTNAPSLDVTLPDGWEIQSQSADGPATYKPSTAEWIWLSGGEYDVTYTVAVPDDADDGEYTVGAEASAIDPATDEFVEDSTETTITVAADDEPPADGLETAVSLEPSNSEVVAGNTVTYDIIVENADGGVGAFDADVSIEDTDVGTITDVSLESASGETSSVTIADDGSSASMSAALMDTDDTGSVTIATITVEGGDEGTTDIDLDISALGTEMGHNYEVTETTGSTLTVVQLGPVGDFDSSPTDPDGDGVYEDVNGDGKFNIVDVQALFAHTDDPTVQNNVDAFDVNGDDIVDVSDVQALFDQLT